MRANTLLNNLYNRFLLENHDIEVIWTLLPVLIFLIFIAIPRLRLFHLIEKSFESIIYAKVMGRQ